MMSSVTAIKDLKGQNTGIHKTEARWFAIYTPFRREKAVIRSLTKKGIMAYTPLLKKVKQYDRKIKSYEVPLINHYVFVKITEHEYPTVIRERDVVRFLNFNKRLVAIPENEIEILQRIVGEKNEFDICERNFIPGFKVEIIQGKLTGICGKVIEEYGKNLIIVDLDHLGLSLRIQIDRKYLNPL